MASIYQQFIETGCEIDHHESDLYVKATPKAWEIIRANMPVNHQAFRDKGTGEHWIDIPFAYQPYWDKRS